MALNIRFLTTNKKFFHPRIYELLDELFEEFKINGEIPIQKLVIEDSHKLSEKEKEELRKVEVLVADGIMIETLQGFPFFTNLKWLSLITSGVDTITRNFSDKIKPSFLLTRNAEFYDFQMSQYVMAFIFHRERHFDFYAQNQRMCKWEIKFFRNLSDLTMGIVGFGSIGKTLANLLNKMEIKVIGLVSQNSKQIFNEEKNGLLKVTKDRDFLLSSSDYVISILPKTPETNGFFDRDVLKKCKKNSVFINIGRGNVVKEESIIKALDEKWISHAVLDVFEVEPFPSSSPLWLRSDVTITPHVSGDFFDTKKFVMKNVKNYKKYLAGETLDHVVDWERGY